MAVNMTVNDLDEYSLKLINVLSCDKYSQIKVANGTLPKRCTEYLQYIFTPDSTLYLDFILAAAAESEVIIIKFC